MGAVLEFSYKLESQTCAECGIEFALPVHFVAELRNSHKLFYCPSGHSLSFKGETEAETLKRQLDAAQREVTYRDNRITVLQRQQQHSDHQARALRGVVTKAKKRVGNGVCPCCNRTFASLARHMKTKHPEYADPVEVP